MTTHPDTVPVPQPMARPFPTPMPMVERAYTELWIAANGTEQEIKALGDPRRLPRPWDPPSCTDPDLRLEIWAWLEDVVTWLNTEYVWDTEGMIPTCWPRHPHLAHEIAVLADQRRRAGLGYTSEPLEEWHRYALPAFTDRAKSRLKQHCDDGHQPWPATGRHARHTNDTETRHRIQSYRDDARATPSDQDSDPGHQSRAATKRPTLALVDDESVDTDTGEVLDP